ncbi:pr1-like protein [Oryza sativa Japonica Group]|uniref:Pr1-like protein n=1 Tax=Oryza sativa subsp. japonica TaxID=39947 RepID=Q8LR23_ORYSJ|nr:pr1-like protein [Oryza sativa Japonica Group]
MVAGGGHRHGGAAAERGEGKGEKRRWSTAHPRSTATTKKAAGAEEGGGAARVDGVDGIPAVGGLGEGVDGVDGGAAKPKEATPWRETVLASGEGRLEVVGDGGEREGDGASSIPAGRRCGKGRKRAREARGGARGRRRERREEGDDGWAPPVSEGGGRARPSAARVRGEAEWATGRGERERGGEERWAGRPKGGKGDF